MRAPNGAKMEPKSALFLSVKIIRIHCKKQGLGSVGPPVALPQNPVFFVLQKKLLVHNPAFRLDGNPIFQV